MDRSLLYHRSRIVQKIEPLKVILIGLLSLCISSICYADNPLVSHVYTADPAARVINGRMYVMATHDQDTQSDYSELVDYYLFSSDDMINWQDHGIVFNVRRDTSWANLAEAPDWVYRNGKYYLYFSAGADSIGVAVSDKPEGPYKDPLGHSLVNRWMPNCNVQWLFHPGVFIDDDGQAYLYFGGGGPGNARVIRLNNDMISVSGSAITIDAPNFYEASYMHKHNGIYYFSYSTTPSSGQTIDYMTSTNPTSGFLHRGSILGNLWENNGDNNHASIVNFNGQSYIFYHNRAVANQRGASSYQRSINVDRLYYNNDGTILLINAGPSGVQKLKNINPFVRNEAETIDNEWGIETELCREGSLTLAYSERTQNLTYLNRGDWIKVSNVDFGSGADRFQARVAGNSNTSIDIILDNINSQPIGTLQVSSTGGYQTWQTQSTTINPVAGLHDLFLRFNGNVNVNWYTFSSSRTPSNRTVEVELENLSGQSSFSPFVVRSDPAASGGKYIVWPNAETNEVLYLVSDITAGQVVIPFTLSQSANVKFQIQANMGEYGADDSFYYVMDSGPWRAQKNKSTNGFQVLTPNTFNNLSAGSHVLRILRREDGAKLDKVILTTSTGNINVNSSISSSSDVPSNLTLEVELENLSNQSNFSPFEVQSDPAASGGQYIVWPNDGTNRFIPYASDSIAGQVVMSFTLSQSANVQFQIRADLKEHYGDDDSFYYKMDSGSWLTQNDIGTNGFQVLTPTTFNNLSAGTHVLRISIREDGAKLDKVILKTSAGNISGN